MFFVGCIFEWGSGLCLDLVLIKFVMLVNEVSLELEFCLQLNSGEGCQEVQFGRLCVREEGREGVEQELYRFLIGKGMYCWELFLENCKYDEK